MDISYTLYNYFIHIKGLKCKWPVAVIQQAKVTTTTTNALLIFYKCTLFIQGLKLKYKCPLVA